MSASRGAAGVAAWVTACALAMPLAWLQPAAAQHEHEGGAHELQLDHGRKWATDTTLRRGMSGIRDAVSATHHAIHADTATAAQYQALAGRIEAQIAYMVENCKLSPQADAQLHLILADIAAGSEAMKSGTDQASRREGAVTVVGALQAYRSTSSTRAGSRSSSVVRTWPESR